MVTVALSEDGVRALGECAPNARYDESAERVLSEIEAIAPAVREGLTRDALQALLPAGSARNALDCALWSLELRRGARHFAGAVGAGERLVTAYTVSLGSPEEMGRTAHGLGGFELVKVKLGPDAPEACIRAVRAALPSTRLIVDANEAWSLDQLVTMQQVLVELGVEMLEQPLAAQADHALMGVKRRLPICADESCRTASDVARLVGKYDMVNIKLDKTGGLTQAVDLAARARAHGLGVMTGCMMSTSLSIAPLLRIAREAIYIDVDAPLWLVTDRVGGMKVSPRGEISAPTSELWG